MAMKMEDFALMLLVMRQMGIIGPGSPCIFQCTLCHSSYVRTVETETELAYEFKQFLIWAFYSVTKIQTCVGLEDAGSCFFNDQEMAD